MVYIGICEDIDRERAFLRQIVTEYMKRNEIEYEIYVYDDGKKLLLEDVYFDIIFLDIDMPEMNGIELGHRIRETNKRAHIIYATGYPEYQMQALEVHFFYFLLKPISVEKIEKQLTDSLEYFKSGDESLLCFKTDTGYLYARKEEILYFEHRDYRIHIVTKQQTYTMKGALKDLTDKLEKLGFASPHKSYLVNLRHVYDVTDQTVLLTNGVEIAIAGRRIRAFKDAFFDFLHQTIDWI